MRRLLIVPSAFLATSCSLFGQQSPPAVATTASPTQASPSPTSVLQSLWVLSPLGLRLHDQPSLNSAANTGIPQGANLTATDFKAGSPGFYKVEYQGATGWIADKDPKAEPPIPLVTTHPQLSYANSAAGYYFLYPASWTVTDKGAGNAEGAPQPNSGQPSAAPGTTPSAAATVGTGDMLSLHEAKDVDSLGNLPTKPGSNLDTTQIEVYGITTIRHIYRLNGGGFEQDVKLRMTSQRAVLITFIAPQQADLDIANEVLYSFGVSLTEASPSPSH